MRKYIFVDSDMETWTLQATSFAFKDVAVELKSYRKKSKGDIWAEKREQALDGDRELLKKCKRTKRQKCVAWEDSQMPGKKY